MTSRGIAAVAAAAVMAFALAYLAPMSAGRGLEMDEGAVVAYADRVLEGGVRVSASVRRPSGASKT